MHNANGDYGIKPQPIASMDIYDSLPPKIRKVLQYAPYNVALGPFVDVMITDNHAEWYSDQLLEQTKTIALHAYGPDHPQSQ